MLKIWTAGASLAAILVFAAPAQAQHWSNPNSMAASSVTVHHASPLVSHSMRHHRGDDRARHGRKDRNDDSFFGGWGYYDPDLNSSWRPDSFNDWWHDRPDRAYPRWVQHNDGCDEGRMWQGGGAWRCSW
jgi:hypothetical protein